MSTNQPSATPIPTRPLRQWPVGVRLRFNPEAQFNEHYEPLRGRPVLVLSELQLIGPSKGQYSWRQQVLSLSTCKVGWARPDQLDLLLDEQEREAY
ncbi:hypothetical protein SAMN04488038_11524 [Solimonas aquatica]|uniref:Uncharacterized protein n=1 Tax=Solimonas aquatica TaxID=489703 RepID=A0A1H9L5C3_9GAMM|nr:hypothetical protein [Solimonas aquatica]SER06634.1 hypothetical protein SAMN04488038_11524 [Solimonas aquatica]